MKEYYNEAIQMIKLLNIQLTKKQYRKIAKRFVLLSPESLEYIVKKSFKSIVLDNVA